ncbi:MAG: hypothetical protein F9K22_11005 [Bacteroidetes bacterium]|nr:MAG: hypothetical protein F9K22_11005 [Bacteroidota bacterium]
MHMAAQVTGYLSPSVPNKDHKLAREARRQFYTIVKDAKGKLSKFDVTHGHIFIELKDETGFKQLQDALAALKDVKVEQVSPIKLVFLKSQAQAGL